MNVSECLNVERLSLHALVRNSAEKDQEDWRCFKKMVQFFSKCRNSRSWYRQVGLGSLNVRAGHSGGAPVADDVRSCCQTKLFSCWNERKIAEMLRSQYWHGNASLRPLWKKKFRMFLYLHKSHERILDVYSFQVFTHSLLRGNLADWREFFLFHPMDTATLRLVPCSHKPRMPRFATLKKVNTYIS